MMLLSLTATLSPPDSHSSCMVMQEELERAAEKVAATKASTAVDFLLALSGVKLWRRCTITHESVVGPRFVPGLMSL